MPNAAHETLSVSFSEPSRSWMVTSSRTMPCVSPTSLMRTLSWREARGGPIMAADLAMAPEADPAVVPRAQGCHPKLSTWTSLWDCWYQHSTSAPSLARREPPFVTSPSRQRASKCPRYVCLTRTGMMSAVCYCFVYVFSEWNRVKSVLFIYKYRYIYI